VIESLLLLPDAILTGVRLKDHVFPFQQIPCIESVL
jgi:hypothetical protein